MVTIKICFLKSKPLQNLENPTAGTICPPPWSLSYEKGLGLEGLIETPEIGEALKALLTLNFNTIVKMIRKLTSNDAYNTKRLL